MPVVHKVINAAKPIFQGTKYGKYVDTADKYASEADKYVSKADKVANVFKGTGGRKMMPQLKFEELDDIEDEEFDE